MGKYVKEEFWQNLWYAFVVLCIMLVFGSVLAAMLGCSNQKMMQAPEDMAIQAYIEGEELHEYLVQVMWPKLEAQLTDEERAVIIEHYESFMAAFLPMMEETITASDTEKRVIEAMLAAIAKIMVVVGG